MDVLDLVVERHYFPPMKGLASILLRAAGLEPRVRRLADMLARSPFRFRASRYLALSAVPFWRQHRDLVPWAVLGTVSCGCRDICRARLLGLGLAGVPVLPDPFDWNYVFGSVVSEFVRADEDGVSFVAESRARSKEARAVCDELRSLDLEVAIVQRDLGFAWEGGPRRGTEVWEAWYRRRR